MTLRRHRDYSARQPTMSLARVHPTACVHPDAVLGARVQVWQFAQIRERAQVGDDSRVGMGCYLDVGVRIGARCKLQNQVCTYAGLTVEDGVFLGPSVVFTNDLRPRALNADGSLRGEDDWQPQATWVEHGASIGANATVLCGVRIGRFALIGAGSVVTRDVPAHGLVRGNPAKLVGFVDREGLPLRFVRREGEQALLLDRQSAPVRLPWRDVRALHSETDG